MILYSGDQMGPIKRIMEPSLYMNYFTSSSQTKLDLKIFKLQIDNQIRNPEFQVAFSKFLPLKTLDQMSKFPREMSNFIEFYNNLKLLVLKPIVEVSMKQAHNRKTNVTEIKSLEVKIEESLIKIDIVFITALLNFFTDQVQNIYNF
jgi:hypothetical protein